MWEWIKSHKLWVIGGVGLIILIYVLTKGSSGASPTGVSDGTDVGAATDLQSAQLQAGAAAGQTAAALQANSDNNDAQIQLADIQAKSAGDISTLQAQVATSNINANQQVQSLLASIAGNVAVTQSNNAVAAQTVAVTGATQQQQILANALTSQAQINASTSEAAINAQTKIATQSWFSKIF